MDLPLTLVILCPGGKAGETHCDSVDLFAADNAQGQGGGSIGIRKGHMPAVIALAAGKVTARADGKTVLTAETDGGFATVKNNIVTVIAQSAKIDLPTGG